MGQIQPEGPVPECILAVHVPECSGLLECSVLLVFAGALRREEEESGGRASPESGEGSQTLEETTSECEEGSVPESGSDGGARNLPEGDLRGGGGVRGKAGGEGATSGEGSDGGGKGVRGKAGGRTPQEKRIAHVRPCTPEREFLIDNLLARIHFTIVMIWWTGLAPWEFEFPFPGSLTSTFLPSPQQPPGSALFLGRAMARYCGAA